MHCRQVSIIAARRTGCPAINRRRGLAIRMLTCAALAQLTACQDNAPTATVPRLIVTASSRAATDADVAASVPQRDPLARWLSSTPGACLVAARAPDGRYPSRPAAVSLPAGLISPGGRTARFAYRGWAAGVSEPVLLAVCTIPEALGAREYFARLFGSRVMSAVALRTFAQSTGVPGADEWGPAASPHAMRGAEAVYMTDGLAKQFPRMRAASRGGADLMDGGAATMQVCDPTAIQPEPGCEQPPPSDGGGGGGWSACDPHAIEPEPGCEETISETEPEPSPEPQVASYSANEAETTPVTCTVGTDNPHRSTTTQFAGNLNVKSWNECTAPMYMAVTAKLLREKCFMWVFCSWPEVASGYYSNPLTMHVTAHAARHCSWRVGWYRGRGRHTTVYRGQSKDTWTVTRAFKISCW